MRRRRRTPVPSAMVLPSPLTARPWNVLKSAAPALGATVGRAGTIASLFERSTAL